MRWLAREPELQPGGPWLLADAQVPVGEGEQLQCLAARRRQAPRAVARPAVKAVPCRKGVRCKPLSHHNGARKGGTMELSVHDAMPERRPHRQCLVTVSPASMCSCLICHT